MNGFKILRLSALNSLFAQRKIPAYMRVGKPAVFLDDYLYAKQYQTYKKNYYAKYNNFKHLFLYLWAQR
jgi:hypothetical protein